jgi:epoxide hydrolase-like predicted phosphatase
MIKVIIFDIGGVLISPEIEKIDEKIAGYIGMDFIKYKKSMEKYKSDLSKGKISLAQAYSKLLPELGISNIDPEKIIEKHLNLYSETIKNLNRDIIKLIEKLKKKYLITCIVNAESDVILLAKKRGLYDFFDKIYISAKLGMKKPDPEIYLAVLNDLQLQPQEAVFIDDKKENVEGALTLGIPSIQYRYGSDLENDLKIIGIKI